MEDHIKIPRDDTDKKEGFSMEAVRDSKQQKQSINRWEYKPRRQSRNSSASIVENGGQHKTPWKCNQQNAPTIHLGHHCELKTYRKPKFEYESPFTSRVQSWHKSKKEIGTSPSRRWPSSKTRRSGPRRGLHTAFRYIFGGGRNLFQLLLLPTTGCTARSQWLDLGIYEAPKDFS